MIKISSVLSLFNWTNSANKETHLLFKPTGPLICSIRTLTIYIGSLQFPTHPATPRRTTPTLLPARLAAAVQLPGARVATHAITPAADVSSPGQGAPQILLAPALMLALCILLLLILLDMCVCGWLEQKGCGSVRPLCSAVFFPIQRQDWFLLLFFCWVICLCLFVYAYWGGATRGQPSHRTPAAWFEIAQFAGGLHTDSSEVGMGEGINGEPAMLASQRSHTTSGFFCSTPSGGRCARPRVARYSFFMLLTCTQSSLCSCDGTTT
jgi:hypothetical protein